ncbi:kanamycin kinase [Treponema bryantii]|uniref:Aminoglycoside 3'-phosphotransferase n=1 Tax=Treponema bryantii TaxID=163 RepID=A0A1H9DI46_9SPIR|nr:APH(3') family aminoglycoside O-phosphotransferase [Treponema bryantii]SEQ13176.1 kanamycin kinase [Treponema bryantii]
MLENLKFPEKIKALVAGKNYTCDDMGKSQAKVLMFNDYVLKIEKIAKKNDELVKMMRWLEGKLPVPKVIAYEKDEAAGLQFLLMSRVTGKMSCDDYYMSRPKELCKLLAQALKLLWSVDISDCPRCITLDDELKEARFRVENNLIDVSDAELTTFGPDGFENPMALLEWLENNRPEREPVFSHGDFCLPNILIEDGKLSGLIDLGDTGVNDKWLDIALCYRSLKHNADGTWGKKIYQDFNPELFFEALGVEPDWDKINYYILLDELF